MKRASLFLTMIVLAAVLLAACGGEQTSTSVPGANVPSATGEPTSTEMPAATDAIGTSDLTTTANVPVTGEDSPNRLTNLINYDVWNQNGEQIGNVDDMLLDFDKSNIAYVVVGTGGFLGLGEKNVLVPWKMLKLQTNGGTTGNQNAFLFTGKEEFYKNAPDTDVNGILPTMGQPAANWDANVKTYWTTGVAAEATGTATQAAEGTATSDASMATATLSADNQGQGNGMGTGQKVQGVILASQLLDSTIQTFNSGVGAGNGQAQGLGTATPAAVQATATGESNAAAATAVATDTTAGIDTGNSLGSMDMTVDDVILDPNSGAIQYLVVTGAFTGGQRTVPVPVKFLRWDANGQSFSLAVNPIALVNAPAIEDGQYPDFSSGDWSAQLKKYWNNLKPD